DHKVVGKHCRSHPQFEALNPFGEAPLHAAATRQHGDAALDAGAKALALLEWCTLLVRRTLGSLLAAALWNGNYVTAAAFTGLHVFLTEEPTIGAIQFRCTAKCFPVALERGRHMDLVRRISFQHFVLSN